MSWIKENPFVAGLAGVTVVAAGGLIFLGTHFSGNYDAAKDAYSADAAEVAKAEKLKPYPNAENRIAKGKAIEDYRDQLVKLQEAFNPYRSAKLEPITAQKFTENLKDSDKKVRAAFAASSGNVTSGTTLPEQFFLGFEEYKSKPAVDASTGILNFQLEAVTEVFSDLAKAAPKEVKNVHRPLLEEESGSKFDEKDAVFRALPLEITFRGTEKSLREFTNQLAASTAHYYVIRTIRVDNEKSKGPVPSDAKFDVSHSGAAASAAADPFAGAFALPSDPGTPGGAKPAAAGDTGRNLQQVLGNENLDVFIRLDVIRFLPAKELSKP